MGDRALLHLLLDRTEFLDALSDGPRERRDLVEDLGVSKSTAHRVLRKLEDQGLVANTSSGYTATAYGRTSLTLFRDLADQFDLLSSNREVFSNLPDDAPLDPGFLQGADIVSTGGGGEPGVALLAETERCQHFMAVSGVHRPELLDPLHRRIVDGDLDAEMVLTKQITDYLEAYHPQKLEDVLRSGRLDLHRLDGDLPYGLVMTETEGTRRTCVIVHDDVNAIQAIVANDTGTAADTFLENYRRYRDEAEPYTVETFEERVLRNET